MKAKDQASIDKANEIYAFMKDQLTGFKKDPYIRYEDLDYLNYQQRASIERILLYDIKTGSRYFANAIPWFKIADASSLLQETDRFSDSLKNEIYCKMFIKTGDDKLLPLIAELAVKEQLHFTQALRWFNSRFMDDKKGQKSSRCSISS